MIYVAVALQTMHEAGFVHRNLNLAAIVTDQNGQLRLTSLEDSKPVDSNAPGGVGRELIYHFPLVSRGNDTSLVI